MGSVVKLPLIVFVLHFAGASAMAQSFYADGQLIEPTETIYDGSQVGLKDPIGLVTVHLEDTVSGKIEGLKGLSLVSCSGTLIASDVVLTAAHCVDGIKKYGANVELTVKYRGLDGAMKSTVMKEYAVYPGYQNKGVAVANDVAVIRVQDPIMDRLPVQLAGPGDLTNGESLLTAGYGVSNKGAISKEELLQDPQMAHLLKQFQALSDTAANKLKKQQLSEQLVKRMNELNESRLVLLKAPMTATLVKTKVAKGPATMLQIESSSASVCEGDSGGPTVKQIAGKLVIIGVHSGSTDADCKAPSAGFFGLDADNGLDVYVPNFSTWISKQVVKWHQQADI